ncbi:MAG: di-trans,poly-cis-decaprenylcistransferase [Deltaproteobacteria bacterium RBG_16_58_17]|nr:MAG: di-trans,poly-cis-decaprenylcistransferase [Deltaproteobacteria bacterium RBG_16_58_17]OHE20248.1 MAG: di-trans,poly-cis-decaprenylcistransferase [Syntrophobacterales bacterium GWF2_56_9]
MKEIDPARVPRHIAIIMDGNGRWAKKHAMGRVLGHRKGAESVRVTVRTCRRIGIRYLTLYAFSMENWLRPEAEVRALLQLLQEYLDGEVQEMMDNDIRLVAIGSLDSLGDPILATIREAMERTAGNQGMVLNLALSYGGRDEIVMAARSMVGDGLAGIIRPEEVTKELFARYLYTTGLPDPDLLIRTGGECRVSNFLLWQSAYTEFYFTDVLWPDFRERHLLEAIVDYQKRERRFGMTSDQLCRT